MNHFHFPSSHATETIAFYSRYFGFEERRTLGKTHVLTEPGGFLLAIDESETSAPLPEGSHLGFSLDSPETVRALFRKMQGEGVSLPGDLREPSPRAVHFYCVDPSGNRIEVGWYAF